MTITISKHPGCISAVGRLEDKIQLTFSNMSWAGPTRLGKRVVCNKSHFSSTWRNTVQGHEAIRRDWMLLSTWRPRISSCIKAHVMRGFSITWANLVPGGLWTTCTPSMMISEHDGSPRQVHLFSFFFFPVKWIYNDWRSPFTSCFLSLHHTNQIGIHKLQSEIALMKSNFYKVAF